MSNRPAAANVESRHSGALREQPAGVTEGAQSVLVMGLGNLVHADDGLGVHAIHLLEKDPRVPPDVTLLDGGTQGLSLIPHISGFKRVLVIDAIDVGEVPGTLLRLEGKSLDNLPGKATVHALGFADLMVALKLLGDSPDEVVLIGVQPQSVSDWNPELTPPVAKALERIPDVVLSQIEAWKRSDLVCESASGKVIV